MQTSTEFHKGEIVLICSVDPYGFNGREYHPHERDVGLTAEVVKAERFPIYDDADDRGTLRKDGVLLPVSSFEVVKVLTFEREPRFLDMIDFEIVKRTV